MSVPDSPTADAAADALPGAAEVWRLLLALRRGAAPDRAEALDLQARPVAAASGRALLIATAAGWRPAPRRPLATAASRLFDLYLPICSGPAEGRLVVAHLGQSLDGRIAADNGRSRYITGSENIIHMHRMRALFDAVLVGADTVSCDDPQLTTRRVPGPHPTRVVLDPGGRLRREYRLYRDNVAPTLAVYADNVAASPPGRAEKLSIPRDRSGGLDLAVLLEALERRGLRRLFVEGGGRTVSRFLQQGLLDRLQITVAPMLLGSGRPALSLAPIEDLAQALRPPWRRHEMGDDVLFDLQL